MVSLIKRIEDLPFREKKRLVEGLAVFFVYLVLFSLLIYYVPEVMLAILLAIPALVTVFTIFLLWKLRNG